MTQAEERRLTALNLRPGDIIGFSGKGLVSDAINIGTYAFPRWGLSHVAIVSSFGSTPLIFESTPFVSKPCVIRNKKIKGVQAHLLKDILDRPGKVWLYRSVDPLDTFEKRRLRVSLVALIGTPYDYFGAFQSRGLLLRILRGLLFDDNITELFCSEYVANALQDAHTLIDIPSISFQSPNSLMRLLVRSDLYQPRTRIK